MPGLICCNGAGGGSGGGDGLGGWDVCGSNFLIEMMLSCCAIVMWAVPPLVATEMLGVALVGVAVLVVGMRLVLIYSDWYWYLSRHQRLGCRVALN